MVRSLLTMVVAVLAGEVISLASLLGALTLTDWLNVNHKCVLHTHRGDHNYNLNEKTLCHFYLFYLSEVDTS